MSREAIFNIIAKEVEKLPPDRDLKWKKNNTQAWLRCPYHAGGMEGTGSFKINLDTADKYPPGHGYCFGCKCSLPWNEIATLFGLRQIGGGQMREATAETVFLRNYDFSDQESHAPELRSMTRWPLDLDWRTVTGPTVWKYNGRSMMMGNRPFLYLPVEIYRSHVGGIRCVTVRDRDNKTEKAYINTTGLDSASSLFGYDVARKKSGPLWIVEGPRDTMRVEQAIGAAPGRCVGLIGSAVTARKIELIRDLDPDSIVDACDPDSAGSGASAALFAAFGNEIPMASFPFRNEKEDPASIEPSRIVRATNRMAEKYS